MDTDELIDYFEMIIREYSKAKNYQDKGLESKFFNAIGRESYFLISSCFELTSEDCSFFRENLDLIFRPFIKHLEAIKELKQMKIDGYREDVEKHIETIHMKRLLYCEQASSKTP